MTQIEIAGRALVHDHDGQAQEHPLWKQPELVDLMVAYAPRGWEAHKLYSVKVPPGKSILEHDHPEGVVLFYLQDSRIIVEGEEWVASKGDFLYVPPRTMHSVDENRTKATRISIALKVRPQPNL